MTDQIRQRKQPKRKIYAVDIFCGVGGLTNGLEKAGIDVRLGVDIDPACEYPYTTNNKAKFLLKSIESLHENEITVVFPEDGIRLMAGCAPCQTFSTYNQKAKPTDKRWWLLDEFSRLVQTIRPELVTMENVPKLQKEKVFRYFLSDLETAGYQVDHRIVNSKDYGIPQHRPRLVLLASRLGPIELIEAKRLRWCKYTVKQAIGNLPELNAGDVDGKDPLHQACELSATNLKRIKASRPGGTWRDWDKDLVADCHKKVSGKTYPSVYGRMNWNEPSPTITTQFYGFGNGRFGHPEQNRAISLREGAILQSFPKNYRFTKPGTPIYKKRIGRLIGNAVPVKLGKAIGKSLVRHIEEISI